MISALVKPSEKIHRGTTQGPTGATFKPDCRTGSAILALTDRLPLNQTLVLSLSIEFDMVNHKILLLGQRIMTTIPSIVPKCPEVLQQGGMKILWL